MRQAGTQRDSCREREEERKREGAGENQTEPANKPIAHRNSEKTTKATLYKQQSQFAMQMTFY